MDFSEFMNKTLFLLCKRMRAEEKTLEFCLDDSSLSTSSIHFDTQIWRSNNHTDGKQMAFLCCNGAIDPVLYHAMTVVNRYLSQNDALCLVSQNDSWFFNFVGHVYHTPETLADEIYWTLTSEVLAHYSLITGINLNLVTAILAERYETSEALGMLAFVDEFVDEDVCNFKKNLYLEFKSSSKFTLEQNNLRLLRKLLEGAGENILLLPRTAPNEPYHCIGYVDKKYEKHFSRMVLPERRGIWTFREANCNIFRIRMGNVLCLQDQLVACLPLLEEELGQKLQQGIKDVILAVSNQKHGSALIFVDMTWEKVASRVNRLSQMHRAIEVDIPDFKKMESQMYTWLAKVDGALLVNTASKKVQFINTIVDGEAIVEGYFDSGARRNVIYSFIANLVNDASDAKVAALIFSEDGGCTLIRGSEVKNLLNQNLPSLCKSP